jgi:hypothetical protein
VGGVFPGEADPAVQLNHFLGRQHGRLAAGRLGQRDRDGGVRVVVGQAGGGVPGRRAGQRDRGPQVGQPVLERLEGANRPGELTALPDVGHGEVEAALGESELLGREHRRPGRQARVDRRRGRLADHDLPGLGVVERDVAQLPGHVQRDDGTAMHPGRGRLDQEQPVRHAFGRNHQRPGRQRVGDGLDQAAQLDYPYTRPVPPNARPIPPSARAARR